MKRLRLKRFWVVLVIFAMLTPLLSGTMKKTDAANVTSPQETETTTREPLTGQMKIWFRTGRDDGGNEGAGDIDFSDPDGFSPVQWNMVVKDDGGFQTVNSGYVEAFLSINGKVEGDWNSICDRVKWDYNIEEKTDADKVIEVSPIRNSTDGVKKLAFTVNAAGIIAVNITATGYNEVTSGGTQVFLEDGDTKYYEESTQLRLSRRIYIGSPLMLYDGVQSSAQNYLALKTGDLGSDESIALDQEGVVYANNADISSCKIFWFYADAETDDQIELQPPVGEKGAAIPKDTDLPRSSKIVSVGEPGAVETTWNGVSVMPYKISVPGKKGGFVRLIARIYLNGDSRSEFYIEKTFDVMVAAEIKKGSDTLKEMELEYGQNYTFTEISNDAGNSLSWKAFETYDTVVDGNEVLILGRDTGIQANNYGVVDLEAVSIHEGYEEFRNYEDIMKDIVKVTVNPALLKGIGNRQKVGDLEVINVGGSITLSTNVVSNGSKSYRYEWIYEDGSSSGTNLTASNGGFKNEVFEAEGQSIVNANNYSYLKITGKKSTTNDIKVVCKVYEGTSTVPFFEKPVNIRILDTMSLNVTKKTIVVGGSFTLSANTTVNNGTNVIWTVEDGGEEFISHEDGENSTVITGLKPSGRFIKITGTKEINGTTVSATCEVEVIPGIKGAEIQADPDSIIPVGGMTDLTLILDSEGTNFSEDEIKWVLKNKDGVIADEIIELETVSGNILKAKVKGLNVGEAYVAVVTNDTAQVEIAVITIRVVSEVTGIKIKGEKVKIEGENKVVKDYLDEEGNGTCELSYTLEPEGFVDEEVSVVWTSSNPNIASVDSETGVVTYHATGTAIITASVGGNPLINDTCIITIEKPVLTLELNLKDAKIKVGETLQLIADVQPIDATDRSIKWETSDESIASVDNFGLVTGIAAGSVTITAITSNGIRESCVVTVLVPSERIELNYYNITVKKGTIFYLSAKVLPVEANDRSVTYTSSDESIVTVDEDGTVTALKVGVAEITVTSNDNPDLTEICTVNVIESVSGLTLNSREITIDVGEQYLLKATVRPSDSLNQEVTFESADPSIATVDENGLITGVKGGVTIIMVRTVERGLMATCTVTVQEDIESITFVETEIYLAKGANKKIGVTIVPASATQKKLLWKSSDESIVIVDADGNIHGVNLGTATITATARDEGKVFATCKVTVIDPMTKLTLNQSIIRIMQRDTYQLTYTVEPSYASVQRVNWTTSNAAVARVDSLGLVTGVAEGEATIRATASDGSGVYAECTVIVTPIILTTSVQVNTPETTMVLGDTRTLSARTQPRNTTETIRWISSDSSVVTIDNNGNARAVGPGVCQIIAVSSVSGIEGTSTITVLGLNANTVTLEQYDTFDLQLSGVDAGVTWFSRNKRVATVTRRGVVTGRREGTTEVVARVNGKLVSCEVNVEKLRK